MRFVSEHFLPDGRPKRKHATREKALEFQAQRHGVPEKGKGHGTVYKCKVCDGWHIGFHLRHKKKS